MRECVCKFVVCEREQQTDVHTLVYKIQEVIILKGKG